jgi:hypothetical protein
MWDIIKFIIGLLLFIIAGYVVGLGMSYNMAFLASIFMCLPPLAKGLAVILATVGLGLLLGLVIEDDDEEEGINEEEE